MLTPPPASDRKSCHCVKSRCLKLYCDCFAQGVYCSGCSCSDCHNREEYAQLVASKREGIKEKNPEVCATFCATMPAHARSAWGHLSLLLREGWIQCFRHHMHCLAHHSLHTTQCQQVRASVHRGTLLQADWFTILGRHLLIFPCPTNAAHTICMQLDWRCRHSMWQARAATAGAHNA